MAGKGKRDWGSIASTLKSRVGSIVAVGLVGVSCAVFLVARGSLLALSASKPAAAQVTIGATTAEDTAVMAPASPAQIAARVQALKQRHSAFLAAVPEPVSSAEVHSASPLAHAPARLGTGNPDPDRLQAPSRAYTDPSEWK